MAHESEENWVADRRFAPLLRILVQHTHGIAEEASDLLWLVRLMHAEGAERAEGSRRPMRGNADGGTGAAAGPAGR